MCCKLRFSSYAMPVSDDLPAVLLEDGLLSNDLDAVLMRSTVGSEAPGLQLHAAMQTNMDVHRISIFPRGRIVAE